MQSLCVVRFENLFPFCLAFNAILDLLSVELSDFDVIEWILCMYDMFFYVSIELCLSSLKCYVLYKLNRAAEP